MTSIYDEEREKLGLSLEEWRECIERLVADGYLQVVGESNGEPVYDAVPERRAECEAMAAEADIIEAQQRQACADFLEQLCRKGYFRETGLRDANGDVQYERTTKPWDDEFNALAARREFLDAGGKLS